MDNIQVLLGLISNSIGGRAFKLEQTIQNPNELYSLAKMHDVSHALGQALIEYKNLIDVNVYKNFEKDLFIANVRHEQIEYELNQVCKILNKEKIYHVPLKGSVIKNYYPMPWLRTSCDIDVLVKKEDLEKAIKVLTEQLEYTYELTNTHDAQLWAPSGVHIELHYDLIEDRISNKIAEILRKAFSYVQKSGENEYTLSFTEDFFMFYHYSHIAKHFIDGGSGIKPFMDLYILEKNAGLTNANANLLLKESGLEKFALCCNELTDAWFKSGKESNLTIEMQNYILSGGVYGTRANSIAVSKERKGGKFKYLFYRVFMPYAELCKKYPKLKGRKILYPFYTVKRWFSLLKKGRLKDSMQETKYLSSDKAKSIADLLKQTGLN